MLLAGFGAGGVSLIWTLSSMRYADVFPTPDLADYDGRGAGKRLKAGHVCRYRCSERECCSIHPTSALN